MLTSPQPSLGSAPAGPLASAGETRTPVAPQRRPELDPRPRRGEHPRLLLWSQRSELLRQPVEVFAPTSQGRSVPAGPGCCQTGDHATLGLVHAELSTPPRAHHASGPKTRVRGFDLGLTSHAGASALSTARPHCPFALGGAGTTSGRKENRYYDPSIGRYLQMEAELQSPKGFLISAKSGGALAAYAYAGNNPIAFSDPTGLLKYPQQSCADANGAGIWMGGQGPGKDKCGDCAYLTQIATEVCQTSGLDNCMCKMLMQSKAVACSLLCNPLPPPKPPAKPPKPPKQPPRACSGNPPGDPGDPGSGV